MSVFWCIQLRNQFELQLNGLQADFDNIRSQLEDETESAANAHAQLQKIQTEYQHLKSKYDKDLAARTDELEEIRYKPVRVDQLLSALALRFCT